MSCERCGGPTSKPSYRHCRPCWAVWKRLSVDPPRRCPPPTPQPTPCRIWQGPVDPDGYGMTVDTTRVHRWVMEQAGHDIAGKVVMHLCDNPPCFRYDHLRVGTIHENNADRQAKGRTVRHATWTGPTLRGEQHGQSKLTDDDVRAIRARIARGDVQRRIAADYGVSPAIITHIKTGHLWGHVKETR